jgi:hypothetical protein
MVVVVLVVLEELLFKFLRLKLQEKLLQLHLVQTL